MNTVVIYISRRFETNIGAKVHRSILTDLYGEDNIYVFDMRPLEPLRYERYVRFGKYKHPISRVCRWIQGNTMYISNRNIEEICSVIDKMGAKLVFLENSDFGNLVRAIKKIFPDITVCCFYHDVIADLYRQWNKSVKTIDVLENKIAIRQEAICRKYSDINVVFNLRDKQLYKKVYSSEPDAVIPLSSFIEPLNDLFIKMDPSTAGDKKKLLFVGSKYAPNIEGIRWFYKNVVPYLNDKCEINIVGRGTEFLSVEFTDEKVSVLGTVDDIFKYYYEADVFIAPLFSGGGMKAKSIEAISLGKCFVGNDESLAGFWEETDEKIRGKYIFKCDDAQDWIDTLNDLTNKSICKFNPEVYQLFIDKFSYNCTKKAFEEILSKRMEEIK